MSVWYVAYGSNLDPAGIAHYLQTDGSNRAAALESGPTAEHEDRWIEIERPLYFAGRSRTWSGAVAFLGLRKELHAASVGRAFLVEPAELHEIFRRENGVDDLPWSIADVELGIDEWAPLPVALDAGGFSGKYNAVLRLPDIDGERAYTLSTSRDLPVGPPNPVYLERIASALGMHVGRDRAEVYLAEALGRISQGPRARIAPSVPIAWRGSMVEGPSYGYPAVTIPASQSGSSHPVGMVLGRVSDGEDSIECWIVFGDTAALSTEVKARLHVDLPLLVTMPWAEEYDRLVGQLGDLDAADVVQVHPDDAARLGRWALIGAPAVSAAVRVQGRSHVVRRRSVRLAYSTRALLSLDPGDAVILQTLPSSVAGPTSRPRRIIRWLSEWLIGAPVLALRALEGLAGDESRDVIRVDATALDYLGISSGDRVIVSWADRSVRADVLLQTDVTRQWMHRQLTGDTGLQVRRDAEDAVAARLKVPPHLGAWMSPTLRFRLGVPTDTIVRLRRDVRSLVVRQAAVLALPTAAISISVKALPDVPTWFWFAVSVAVLVLALVPLRRRRR